MHRAISPGEVPGLPSGEASTDCTGPGGNLYLPQDEESGGWGGFQGRSPSITLTPPSLFPRDLLRPPPNPAIDLSLLALNPGLTLMGQGSLELDNNGLCPVLKEKK